MICKKCAKKKHYKCKNGAWKIGTHCTCQHRVKVPQGYAMYLLHKFGNVSEREAIRMVEERDLG